MIDASAYLSLLWCLSRITKAKRKKIKTKKNSIRLNKKMNKDKKNWPKELFVFNSEHSSCVVLGWILNETKKTPIKIFVAI